MSFYYVGNQRYRSRVQKYIFLKSKDLIIFFIVIQASSNRKKFPYSHSYLFFSLHILITILIIP
jgi:hypothetical protein